VEKHAHSTASKEHATHRKESISCGGNDSDSKTPPKAGLTPQKAIAYMIYSFLRIFG